MIDLLKSRLRDGRMHRWLQRPKEQHLLSQWYSTGCPLPPPAVYKQSVIREHARHFGTRILVETGTCAGATTAASLHTFDFIHTIELSTELHSAACRRFKRHRKVRLWNGDSGIQLPRVLNEVDEPALFWLDAHYSGDGTARADIDTPISQELQAISKHQVREHVLLIDDARLFDGTNGYPSIEGCWELVSKFLPTHEFAVEHDIIRITPGASQRRNGMTTTND